jgi:hypothetical protein
MALDPLILTTLITSVATLLVTIFQRVSSSKCFGTNGIDLEFSNPNTNTITPAPTISKPTSSK